MMTSSSSSTAFAAGTLVLPYCASFSPDPGEDWIPFKDCRFDFGKLARDPKLSYVIEQVDYLVRTEYIAVSVQSVCSTLLSGSSTSTFGLHIGQGGGEDDKRRTYMRIWILPAEDAGPEQAARLRSSKRALLSARSEALRAVLGMVDCSIEAWEGRVRPLPLPLAPTDTNTAGEFFSPRLIRGEEEPATPKTLSGVFQSLASPRIDDARLDGDSREVVSDMLQAQAGGGEVEGLRSVLYGYQARSVAKMLQEELCLPNPNDPTYLRITPPIDPSQIFVMNPSTLEVRREPEQYVRARRGAAGILAEDPGSGKTIMILALILATRYKLPSAIPSSPYTTPRITTLALHRTTSHSDGFTSEDIPASVPSLRDLSLHRIRTATCPSPSETFNLPAHLASLLLSNTPFYMDFYPDSQSTSSILDFSAVDLTRSSSSRKTALHPQEKIFLSAATLIVVPAMLRGQWDAEIMKHVEHDALRVLVLKTQSDVASVEALANDYDVILMSYEVFAWAVKYRAPCSCQPPPGRGYCLPALLHICWKRLVIDEGNICGSGVTELVSQLQMIKAENKWIVTGTPTAGLVGGIGESSTLGSSKETNSVPPWTSRDRDDLNRLSYMIGGFLAIPPFHLNEHGGSGVSYFKSAIIDPLCQPGDSAGRELVIEALRAIMERVIIRHRAEDRMQDIRLPPLTHETVLLDLDQYGAMTYNIMQTVIAVNAIDSEREGQDYLFSPQNVGHLRNLILNVTQSLFWHVDEKLFDIDQAVDRTREALEKLEKIDPSSPDLPLLRDSLRIQEEAAANDTWRTLMTSVELPYRIAGLSCNVGSHWSRSSSPSPTAKTSASGAASLESEVVLLGSTRIDQLRRLIAQCPPSALTEVTLREAGEALQRAEQARKEEQRSDNSNTTVDPDSRSSTTSPRKVSTARSSSAGKVTRMAKTGVTIPDTTKPRPDPDRYHHAATPAQSMSTVELNTLMNSRQADIPSDSTDAALEMVLDGVSVKMTTASDDSPLVDLTAANIGRSGSAKLDFILDEIRRYSPEEKFLIFSSGQLTLAHIADGLALMGINYLQLSGGQSKGGKEQVLTTFRTSDDIRVLLMELRYGARGLNITEASRIIFCEPVWGLDVESQAIKRAHRIGQTRPIIVKTLAVGGTFEEEVMKQRDPNSHSKDVCVDDGMRGFLMRPAFIGHRDSSTLAHEFTMPLITTPFGPREPPQTDSTIAMEVDNAPTIPSPRKRTIRFVENDPDDKATSEDETGPKRRRPTLRFDV